MREVALVACLLGAMAWGSATVVRAETPYEADPGLIPMDLFTVFFNTEGPLSYATLRPGDLPAEAVPLGTVKGRGCQYGVSIPIGGTSFITRVSGAVGHGGYEKALSTTPQKKGGKRIVNIWAMLYQGVPYGPQNESYPFAQS